ncbi:MAG: glycogen/starch/alpha-glucan phosphorylase [Thermodesulfobacteriota bacterium]
MNQYDTPEAIAARVRHHMLCTLGKSPDKLTENDLYLALSYTVRDRLAEGMVETAARYERTDAKRVYYLSMEFLIGRSLQKNLYVLGMYESCKKVAKSFGLSMEAVCDEEPDAALGNGGLGRLAACYLDSMATLALPGFGYGIHYDYGLFRQDIQNGYQVEKPDHWQSAAGTLHVERADQAMVIPLYGKIDHAEDRWGNYNPMWMDWNVVIGVPYDIPIPGYGGRSVNYLRLFTARPSTDFDIKIFNQGDYLRAVEQKISSEKISKILYPQDKLYSGKELRLTQEYFLTACALRDIMRGFLARHPGRGFAHFPDHAAIQLNDTHPALAVAELMRMLVDEHWVDWEAAWDITTKTISYTNHTLLPEALEKWPVDLMQNVLPRHMQIIFEINRRFLDSVAEIHPGDEGILSRTSLIEEGEEKQVRMANLAIVGSRRVNGVSKLHSELLKTRLVPDFARLWPEKFVNVTNGITPRRFLLTANPELCALARKAVGGGFISDMALLKKIEPMAEDPAFRDEYLAIRRRNKEKLSKVIFEATLITVDPDSLFDIQAKRIHEYKRQLLNALAVVAEYLAIVEDGQVPPAPRTCIFAGKAAPGYRTAKDIIKLIHCLADTINRDKRTKGALRVVFVPDFRVTLAERMVCATDVSEQISTAGYEASGTGNMKFALNGALTLGTLDGANIEIMQKVGKENVYIFGRTAEELALMEEKGGYHPIELYNQDAEVRRALDALRSDRFNPAEPGLLAWISHYLLSDHDKYFHLADFPDYREARFASLKDFTDKVTWAKKGIMNTARMGYFSSDRSILQYAERIWGATLVPPEG